MQTFTTLLHVGNNDRLETPEAPDNSVHRRSRQSKRPHEHKRTYLTYFLPDFIAAGLLLEAERQVVILSLGPDNQRILARERERETTGVCNWRSREEDSHSTGVHGTMPRTNLLFLVRGVRIYFRLQQQGACRVKRKVQ